MKSLQSLFLIIAFVFSGMTSAQDVDDAQQAQRNGNKGMEKILTPDQLALLQEQNDLVKSHARPLKTPYQMTSWPFSTTQTSIEEKDEKPFALPSPKTSSISWTPTKPTSKHLRILSVSR